MTSLKPGDEVRVVEHDDATRAPKEGGRVLHAVVSDGETNLGPGQYILVRYDTGQPDTFWRKSGWRAWDSEFRWRLEPVEALAEVARTFAPVTEEG